MLNYLKLDFTPSKNPEKGKMNGEGYLKYNPKTNTFSCEASDAQLGIMYEVVVITNTVTKQSITFKFTRADKDGSGEDTYGWNFKAVSGHKKPCNLLIIND